MLHTQPLKKQVSARHVLGYKLTKWSHPLATTTPLSNNNQLQNTIYDNDDDMNDTNDGNDNLSL